MSDAKRNSPIPSSTSILLEAVRIRLKHLEPGDTGVQPAFLNLFTVSLQVGEVQIHEADWKSEGETLDWRLPRAVKLQASSRITLKWKSPAPSHEAWRREWSVIVWEDIYALGLDGRHSDPSTLEFQKGHDDATVSLFVRIEEVHEFPECVAVARPKLKIICPQERYRDPIPPYGGCKIV